MSAAVADALYNLGGVCEELEKFDSAADAHMQAANSGIISAMNNLAVLYIKLGELDKAEAWLVKAVDRGH